MTKKIFAVVLLSLALTACESSSNENANANAPTKPIATPAAPSPTAPLEASPSAASQIKAGDKVKVTVNGVATEASVVSIDEKAGKATVRIQGQKEDRTVAISEVVKQ